MHTIERASAEVTTSVPSRIGNRASRTWTVPAALAIVVTVAAVTAVTLSDAEPVNAEPSADNALVAVQGETYVVAGGQTPVLSTPAVSAPVPHVVSGGQAPAWNTGAPLVEIEPDPIPVWRPTRDKPGGR